jgi:hypothetical protein
MDLNNAHELISKGATTNWRMMLIATSVLLGIDLGASEAAGQGSPAPPSVLLGIDLGASEAALLSEASRVATSHACQGDFPGPYEVFIFTDIDYRGQCASLRPGLYPYSWTLGLPNHSITSIMVGEHVRVRLFRGDVYGGDRARDIVSLSGTPDETCDSYTTGERFPTACGLRFLTGFNDSTASMRVELDSAGWPFCGLFPNYFGLFEDASFNSFDRRADCVVLPVFRDDGQPNDFPTPQSMGIRNDSISSLWANNSSCDIEAFTDPFFGGRSFRFPKSRLTLAGNGNFQRLSDSINDRISSIRLVDCLSEVR